MCGIIGISAAKGPIWHELLDGLIHLQHRGQDAAGIVTSDTKFHSYRGSGLAREVFRGVNLDVLSGSSGIAHVRYPTHGAKSDDEIQPFWTSSPFGISLAHNGNIVNYSSLKKTLNRSHYHHLNTESDSELLLHIFASRLRLGSHKKELSFVDNLFEAVNYVLNEVRGGYSVVSCIIGKGMCAFRDPNGIRPLVIGRRENKQGQYDYIFASEPTMFYQLGYQPYGDVAAGEVVFVNKEGQLFRRQLHAASFRPCIFEYIYFARPDALINDVSVYRARLRMGQNLAKQWLKVYPNCLPDVVIPVPFSSNTAALAFANTLAVRYTEGLYKNPFIGRTFIMPTQGSRKKSVRHKLIPQETEIRKKNVLLLDDSIVRGTTSKEIVAMMREFGAKNVYFATTCPTVKFPCFYGIDMPTQQELIAYGRSDSDIADYLKVDKLLYQDLESLQEAVMRKGQHKIDKPCMACLDGDYVCGKKELLEEVEGVY